MKIGLICGLIFINSNLILNAQGKSPKKIYKARIDLNKSPIDIVGVLYEIKDSSVSVSNSLVKSDYSTNNFTVVDFQLSQIETINIRNKNSVLNGVFIGFFAGFAIGGLIGLAAGDDPPCQSSFFLNPCIRRTAEDKALLNGIFLSMVGTGLGAGLGSIKVKIPINGRADKFDSNRSKLNSYSIKKN